MTFDSPVARITYPLFFLVNDKYEIGIYFVNECTYLPFPPPLILSNLHVHVLNANKCKFNK